MLTNGNALRIAVAASVVMISWPAAVAQDKAPQVEVSLRAAVEAVGPGEPFELGLKFELPDGFHIYWENPGDSGLAPHVDWAAPAGFVMGPLRFPTPSTHEAGGLITNVLEGTPVLLTTVTPPGDLPANTAVEFKGNVTWLVCKEACFRGAGEVQMTLPTAASARSATDEDTTTFFKIARAAMPVPAGESKLVAVKPAVSQATVAKGDRFEVTLDVAVAKGFHIQSNKPLGEYFVPAEVFVRSVVGLDEDKPVWPDPHVRTQSALGQVSEFDGSFQIRIPVKVEAPTLDDNIAVSGLFKYQACDEKGRCHRPESVEWTVNLRSEWVRTDQGDETGKAPVTGAEAQSHEGSAIESASEGGPSAGKRTTVRPIAEATPAATPPGAGFSAWLEGAGLLGQMIAGFLGGLILNIMPCVLPVISIKILSFVQQAHESPKRVFDLGLTYAAGIVVSFWLLAAGILLLQQVTRTPRGWGAFFQEPEFVVAMICIMFVFALNLFGVFEINLPGATTGKLATATEREGFGGAFMKGVLATLLATPCTAPFLASAISFALAGGPLVTMVIFTSAGVGMAFPYLVLTAKPAWMKYLPKAGGWMVTFKQFMGFLLIGTAVWLLWILGALVGVSGVVWTTGFLGFLGMACWLYGKVEFNWPATRKITACAAAFGIVLFGGWFSERMYVPQAEAASVNAQASAEEIIRSVNWSSRQTPWVPYRPGLAQELAAKGQYVYMDYTAVWCATCQLNKKLVFGSDEVVAKMRDLKVIPIKADYTKSNPDISEDLQRFNRSGVPLNLIYAPNKPDEPIVLPVLLKPGIVLEGLQEAVGTAASAPASPPAAAE